MSTNNDSDLSYRITEFIQDMAQNLLPDYPYSPNLDGLSPEDALRRNTKCEIYAIAHLMQALAHIAKSLLA